jgi:hypothetical protein
MILSALTEHVPNSTIGAAAASAIATAGVTTQLIPLPDGTPPLLAAALTILGPVITLVASRLLAARAARKRATAKAKEDRAARRLADGDPKNDHEAERLLDEAAEDRAEADALEALKPRQ